MFDFAAITKALPKMDELFSKISAIADTLLKQNTEILENQRAIIVRLDALEKGKE